jgi:hypothetical protein
LSKTAAIEEKLDGIVSLLHQRTQFPQPSPALTPNQTPNESLNSLILPSETAFTHSYAPPTPIESSVSTASPPFPNLDYPCPNSGQIPSDTATCRAETDEELNIMLDTYRNKMIPFFPVAIIDPQTTVQEMQNERPFLWLVIRANCCKSQARQNLLELEVRKRLAQAMLMDCTKDLDLLFGTLVYAAWGHYYVYKKRVVSTVIQLCMSLAGDMGLTKPVPAEVQGVMREFNAQGCPKMKKRGSLVRTIEERRAVIGLFYVSSL